MGGDMQTGYSYERIAFPAEEGNPRAREGNWRNGEGDVIEFADGRLLLVFGEFLGWEDHAPATLQGAISRDHGRTWEDKHLVQENIGRRNVMSVSLLRLPGGEILMGFMRKDERLAQCTPFLRRSADEGRTWSPPEPVVAPGPRYHVSNSAAGESSCRRSSARETSGWVTQCSIPMTTAAHGAPRRSTHSCQSRAAVPRSRG
jgi:hypothetical protein